MATFNFSNGTTIINSKMGDVINNVEIGGVSGGVDRAQLLSTLAVWKSNGLPAADYETLRQAAERIETVGKNEPTKGFLEKLAGFAKTGGAALEAYSGLATIVGHLSSIVA